MKTKLNKLILSIVPVLLLAACGTGGTAEEGGETGSGEVDELTVWTWDPNFNIRAMEMAEGHYQEDNPDFSLEIVENAQDDIVQSLNTNLASGVNNSLPNIVFIEDYRAQSFLQSYPDAFYPVTDYYNQEDFSSYKVAAGTANEEIYGVPFDSGVTGLYVRTDLLEEAGYTTEDLTNITWSEYAEIGMDVTEQTGTFWLTNDPNDLGIIRTMIQSSGEWYTEEDGETPNITDNEPLRMAFEIYKEMHDNGSMTTHNGWDQLLQNVNGGQVATSPTGNWFTPSITQEESQSGDWAVVPYPRQDIEGSVNASNLGGSSIYVMNVDGKEQAAEFLSDTFGSDTDFYQDLATEIGAVGAYEPAHDGEGYTAEVEYFDGQQINQDFAEWTQEIPEVEFGLHTYAIEDLLSIALQEYLNGADLDDVLENAQQQAESSLN